MALKRGCRGRQGQPGPSSPQLTMASAISSFSGPLGWRGLPAVVLAEARAVSHWVQRETARGQDNRGGGVLSALGVVKAGFDGDSSSWPMS